MNRRDFLKGTAGLVVACGLGFGKSSLGAILEDMCYTGPKLIDDLKIVSTLSGADVFAGGQMAFQVNALGAKLLQMADGSHDIAAMVGAVGSQYDVAMFFVTLGEAGYLKNNVVASVYERRI